MIVCAPLTLREPNAMKDALAMLALFACLAILAII
jgi:hypothetical protein